MLNARTIKKINRRTAWIGLAAILLLAAAMNLPAQSTAPTKIGVVDMERIARRSSTIRAKIGQAEQEIQIEREKADLKLKELQRLRQNLRDRQSVLTQQENEEQEKKIGDLREEIGDMDYKINKQLERIQSEVIDPEMHRIIAAIEKIAKTEQFDLILPTETVLFHTDRVDITALVIQELDKEAQTGAKKTDAPVTTAQADTKVIAR